MTYDYDGSRVYRNPTNIWSPTSPSIHIDSIVRSSAITEFPEIAKIWANHVIRLYEASLDERTLAPIYQLEFRRQIKDLEPYKIHVLHRFLLNEVAKYDREVEEQTKPKIMIELREKRSLYQNAAEYLMEELLDLRNRN